jgi:NAD(P)-dependent dehydrogenase (short-subunit alcohol dehydrogenase family)
VPPTGDGLVDVKTALVTGANRGIGAAVASMLEALGMVVLRGSRSGGPGFVHLDVTSPSPLATLSLDSLDVLVNNAGISGPLDQPPGSASLATVRSVFETNFFGVLAVSQAALPLLRRSPAARIVNVTSGLGSLTRMSDPDDYFASLPPSAAYAPSKTALNALTVQMAKELRPFRILVNAADPGPCATDFTAHLGRDIPRTAEDGARIIVRLATLDDDGPTGLVFNEAGRVPF